MEKFIYTTYQNRKTKDAAVLQKQQSATLPVHAVVIVNGGKYYEKE